MTNQDRLRTMLVFLINLSLLLSSCTFATETPRPTESQIATAVASPTSPATRVPLATPTQQTAPSLTPTQVAIIFLPTTFERPGAWNLRHPYSNPAAPKLIDLSQDGYQLDPGFRVAAIELCYRWIGIGPSVHQYQRIDLRDSGFWLGDKPISFEAVDKLIKSVNHLRREPQVLTATTGSDDYPFWTIELTSLEGDKLLLYSGSNSASFIPWNVIYNGEIYSQYDEGIPSALDGLFKVFDDRMIVSTWEGRKEGYLPAVTFETPPRQLSRGFSGLLPVNNEFWYVADAQKGELRGDLSGEVITDRVGELEIDWLSGLQSIEIDAAPGVTVPCSLENIPVDYPDIIDRRFSCPVGIPGDSISYRYPIRMSFATSAAQPYILSGELFGYWEASLTVPLVPYPEEIGEILAKSPIASDLLRDHLVYVQNYFSSADADTGIITHEWDADVVLLGQVQVDDRIIPYSVKLDEVNIKDGQLTHWDLDRAELEDLLREVLSQTVTQRFLEFDPHGLINLYYAEDGEFPVIRSDDLPSCSYLPAGNNMPQPTEPLRGFAFNQITFSSGFYDIQVVLIDGLWRIFQLDLRPASPGDAYWISVLPDALKPQGAPPFMRITTFLGGPVISLMWDAQLSPTYVSIYESMFAGWNTTRLTEYDQAIQLNQRWFDLTPQGGLVLLDCKAP